MAMRVARRATVAFIFLIAPQLFPGQALNPSRSAQQTGPQQQAPPEQANVSQTSATQPARTPREDAQLHADILMARKEYAEAAALYQKLLQQEPRNALLLNKIGIAYHQQSMLDQAKRYYERATKADRTYASAYNNIGTIHYQRKNFSKAIRAYKKALGIHPDMAAVQDRKSTRLNSSHLVISYAVFCLKKKKKINLNNTRDSQHGALAVTVRTEPG